MALQTIADVIREPPADNNGSIPLSFGSGFAAGASGISLRGLTANSTLVLINGRRTAPYGLADDGQRNFVNIKAIPLEAVEHRGAQGRRLRNSVRTRLRTW